MTESRSRQVTFLRLALGSFVAFLLFVFAARNNWWYQPVVRPTVESSDLMRIKQLGVALLTYANDNDSRFPPDMSCARSALAYVDPAGRKEILLGTRNGQSKEWLGNGSLASAKAESVPDPAYTLMFFDSAPRKRGDAEPDYRLTVNADTSCRRLEEDLFQRQIANGWRREGM